MSSTKNTKENRKVVSASFYIPDFVFKIPDGLDLEDKEVVEDWWVKYGTLHIRYVGKEDVEEIDPHYDDKDYDYKWPKTVSIEDAYDEYEEEDEEEQGDQEEEN